VHQLDIKVLNVTDARCNHEVQNTHFRSVNFFPKIVLFMRRGKKYCTARLVTNAYTQHM